MRSSGPNRGEWSYPRLLVVEDNPVNQRLAERVLAKMNYCVDVVGDGLQAVEAVQHKNYLAILMDCQMPVMDGLEAATRIRTMPGLTGRTPIIAMTALDTADARQRCLRAGMNAFATKPVNWMGIEVLLRKAAAGGLAERVAAEAETSFDLPRRSDSVRNRDDVAPATTNRDASRAISEAVQLLRSETQGLFDRLGDAIAGSTVGESRARLNGQDRIDDAIQYADQMWDKLGAVLHELDSSVAGRSDAGTPRTAAWAPPTADPAPEASPSNRVGDLIHGNAPGG